jgi:peptide-methionine (R)-S-oxide reductase
LTGVHRPRGRGPQDFTEPARLLKVLSRPFDEPALPSAAARRPTGSIPPRHVPFIMSHDSSSKTYPVQKTDAEWREQLDPMQYEVARHAATERAFTGKYWDHFENGRYNCVGCGTPLFEAGTKFDAGCGWPSYWAPVNSEVIERVVDRSHGMVRVEVRCNKCGSHLGHVFPDGPQPTGERYCINSAAIDFVKDN